MMLDLIFNSGLLYKIKAPEKENECKTEGKNRKNYIKYVIEINVNDGSTLWATIS